LKVIRSFLLIAVVAVAGGLAYIYFSGGSGEPSTDLTTPELNTTASTEGETETTVEAVAAFVIVPEESLASFQLGEVLFGESKTVVGTTSEVAGQVLFDPVDPASAEFSEILINARTLETDRANRDRAMRSAVVLDSGSDEHEFISFMPTAIEGLDGPIAVGDEITFDIAGDLTIKGTTQPVTFSVTVVLEAADRLSGRAEAEVLRTDFGIDIPRAPGVADVTEEVTITLEFVAVQA
jgi:polyisoprenoid-binding protein YceI